MKYYKIIKDDEFLGVVSSLNFACHRAKHNYLGNSDEEHGQFVSLNGRLYRTTWMQPLPDVEYDYEDAIVEEISPELYDKFCAAIEANETVDTNPPIAHPVVVEEPRDVTTIEYARQLAINQFSNECNKAIEEGVEVNGEHFSLTTSDQLNLLAAENTVNSGADVLFHADGEDYRYYTAEEIHAIVGAAASWRIYNTLYYKALKAYINSLEDVNEILSLHYGVDIPNEFKSNALKQLEQE